MNLTIPPVGSLKRSSSSSHFARFSNTDSILDNLSDKAFMQLCSFS